MTFAPWMGWLLAVMGCSLSYNVSMKLTSAGVPMWGFLFVAGALLMTVACWLFVGVEPSQRWVWVDGKNLIFLGCLGVSLALLEVCMFNMYGSGAPVAIARGLTATVSMVALLIVGVLFFKEQMSAVQVGGVFVAVAGVVMMVWR